MGSSDDRIKERAEQLAVKYLLIDLISSRYLAHPDPTQAAVDHRALLRGSLTGQDLSAMGPSADIVRQLVVDELEAILDQAGQAASRIAAKDGR